MVLTNNGTLTSIISDGVITNARFFAGPYELFDGDSWVAQDTAGFMFTASEAGVLVVTNDAIGTTSSPLVMSVPGSDYGTSMYFMSLPIGTHTFTAVLNSEFGNSHATFTILVTSVASSESSSTHRLVWDKTGERVFKTGIDRGVLYKPDGYGVPWNGLTSVEESNEREIKQFYLEGIKYLEYQALGSYAGKLKAFTYPDEFDEILGVKEFDSGLFLHDQPPSSFGLSYRTRIGNDTDGIEHGYEIHILWELQAIPDSISYATLSDATQPIEFGWALSATPQTIPGFRPTAHVSLRSTDTDPDVLSYIEDILYGTDTTAPTLPPLSDLFVALAEITITDNEDGTWTAVGPISNIRMTDEGVFWIDAPSVFYIDADLYQISTCALD